MRRTLIRPVMPTCGCCPGGRSRGHDMRVEPLDPGHVLGLLEPRGRAEVMRRARPVAPLHHQVLMRTCRAPVVELAAIGRHRSLRTRPRWHDWGQTDSAPGQGSRLSAPQSAVDCAEVVAPPSPCVLWAGRSTKGPTNSLRNAHASPGPASGVKQQRRAVNVGLGWDCPRGVVPCLQPALSERFARRSAGWRRLDAGGRPALGLGSLLEGPCPEGSPGYVWRAGPASVTFR